MGPAVFGIFVLLFVAIVVLSIWFSAQRRKELSAWAAARGLTFSPGNQDGFDGRFPEFKCLSQGEDRYAYNLMEGSFQTRYFLGFDYHYETHSHDSKGRRQTHHHHFSAVVLGSQIPLQPLFLRPEGFFDKVTEFFGHDDIDFESSEFSRKFYVKAEKKRWAYDVIHPRMMEFLLGQPQFTIQFGCDSVIAYRSSRFSPPQFGEAAMVVHGMLERLPEYLLKQQLEGQPR